jgi:UDP-3-O-[3-hydroxymyristoyl] glucosamine N-acyltransferase
VHVGACLGVAVGSGVLVGATSSVGVAVIRISGVGSGVLVGPRVAVGSDVLVGSGVFVGSLSLYDQ